MGGTNINRISVLVLGGCLSASALFADFSYTQTTKITGGAMMGMMRMAGAFSRDAREPITQTIVVKGDKMARIGKHQTEIIDLAAETVTTIDVQRKSYSVATFEEYRKMMEEAQARMKEHGGGANVSFKVSANATGKSRVVNGLNAKELQVTVAVEGQQQKEQQDVPPGMGAMSILSDMWMVRDIAGWAEVEDFQRRMAAKLAIGMGSMMGLMSTPGGSGGYAEMAKEMSKVGGVPVQIFIKMGSAGMTMPSPEEAERNAKAQEQQQQQQPKAGDAAGNAAGSAIANRLGGLGGRFGGFGRKKAQEQQQQEQQQQPPQGPPPGQQGPPPQGASFMESVTESGNFSTAPANASQFEIPAGFKKVDAEKLHGRGR